MRTVFRVLTITTAIVGLLAAQPTVAQSTSVIVSLAWNPDGSILAVGGVLDGQSGIRLYDAAGLLVKELSSPARATSLSWSPDGTKIAARVSGQPDTFYVWDVNSENVLFGFEQPGASADRFAYWRPPDGEELATIQGRNVFIRDALDGSVIKILRSPGTNPDTIEAAAWSLDGTRLFTANTDNVVRVWDVQEETVTTEFRQPSSVTAMALSPDGTRLAVASSDRMIRILNAATGAPLNTFQGSYIEGPGGVVWFLRWHPSGNQIASASFAAITVWDFTTERVVATIPEISNSVPWAVDYSPEGSLAYGGEGGSVKIAPIANAGPDQTLTDSDSSGSELVTLDGSVSADSDGTIVSYSWSENGVEIATGVSPQIDLSVGLHTIILTVTDDDGATGGDVVVITVEPPRYRASRTGTRPISSMP